MNVYSKLSDNNQKRGSNITPYHVKNNKKNVVKSYNGTLFGLKKRTKY
jgi:hypothetical protein